MIISTEQHRELTPQMAQTVDRAVRDTSRLEALRRTAMLDTPAEEVFDRLTRMAVKILDVPVGLVSLVDDHRQFFKSAIGLPEPWASRRETPLTHSFCKHVVATGEPLLIENSRVHPLVKRNGAVDDLGVISYAGMPLKTSDGHTLGSSCVIDTKPREWDPEEIEILRDLADSLVYKIELRMAMLEAEREREEKTTILRRISDGFFAVDSGWRIIYINPRAMRLLGRAGNHLEGMSFWDAFPELIGGSFEHQCHRATSEQATVTFEEHYAPLDTWLEVHLYPSSDGLSVYFQDISDRRHLEDELRLHDQAIAAASEGVIIADARKPDFPILYVNQGFQRMTGYTAAEVLGRNCRFLQGRGTDADSVAQIRDALQQRRGCQVELLNYRKDGTPFYNELSLSPVRDAEGRVTHFVGVQKDITTRKEAEAALQESQEKFLQSQKLEAVGRLAGGMAHDFNNLLTVISGYTVMMLAELTETDPLRRYAEQVDSAATQSSSLTRQLLAFSRKQVLKPEVRSLNAVVNNLSRMLGRLIGEHIEVVTLLDSSLGPVRVDAGQMEQVLMNLAVNARDAMNAGGTLTLETQNVEVTVENRPVQEMEPGSYVALLVSDTGHGMMPEVQRQVFEPFFTTKERGKGTGLGLSTVYGIIKQSGGHICLDSEPGRGTTLRIYLPRVQPDTDARPAEKVLSTGAGTETVLVVEDDAGVRALAARILRQKGYNVLEASNAGEALLIAESQAGHIHLMLTDMVLPRMNGADLFNRLRAVRPEMKVLFMSGYSDEAMVQMGVTAPDAMLLEKPFTPDVLTYKVREVLGPQHPIFS